MSGDNNKIENNFIMDNTTFTKLTAIAFFFITYFTCISEIISLDYSSCVYPNTLPIICCQLFSVFMFFVFKVNKRKPIFPILFLLLLSEIKNLMYTAHNLKLLIIYSIILIIAVILLSMYSKFDKTSNNQEIVHKV